MDQAYSKYLSQTVAQHLFICAHLVAVSQCQLCYICVTDLGRFQIRNQGIILESESESFGVNLVELESESFLELSQNRNHNEWNRNPNMEHINFIKYIVVMLNVSSLFIDYIIYN